MTDEIDLSNFYSGGYFLVQKTQHRWQKPNKELLPEKLISLSKCICPIFDVTWAWKTGDKQKILDVGILESKFDEFIHWSKQVAESDIDMWSMFYSPDSVRRFIQQFLLDTRDLMIIGAGLPRELAEKSWQEPREKELYGVEKRIKQRLPLENGGQPLGFEVVSFSYGDLSHSWLCNDLEAGMYQQFSIRPNKFGLIEKIEEAQKVYNWIDEDETDMRAEPEPYDYWLLISYPL
jgi:hypothetical protein